jgi:hypothetical protein
MARQFTLKVYTKDNGTVSTQTISAVGNAGESLSKFFCVNDGAIKYEIYDELNQLLDTVDLTNVVAGGGATSGSGTNTNTTWETLTACCNTNWLLTQNTNHIIATANNIPITLSS